MRWLLDKLALWALRRVIDRMFPPVPVVAEHHPWRIVYRHSGLRFPNHPVYPTKPLVFDDKKLFKPHPYCAHRTYCDRFKECVDVRCSYHERNCW